MRPALFALALLTAAASAQDAPADTLVLRPGDPTLVTDWLASGSQTTQMKLVQPMQQDVGTSTDAYTVADGRVTKVTTLSIPMQGMNQRDFRRGDGRHAGAADAQLDWRAQHGLA